MNRNERIKIENFPDLLILLSDFVSSFAFHFHTSCTEISAILIHFTSDPSLSIISNLAKLRWSSAN